MEMIGLLLTQKSTETIDIEVSKIEELIMFTEQLMIDLYEHTQKNKTFKMDDSTMVIHESIQRLKTIQSEMRDMIEDDSDY